MVNKNFSDHNKNMILYQHTDTNTHTHKNKHTKYKHTPTKLKMLLKAPTFAGSSKREHCLSIQFKTKLLQHIILSFNNLYVLMANIKICEISPNLIITKLIMY